MESDSDHYSEEQVAAIHYLTFTLHGEPEYVASHRLRHQYLLDIKSPLHVSHLKSQPLVTTLVISPVGTHSRSIWDSPRFARTKGLSMELD